jgi:hypothetical protein
MSKTIVDFPKVTQMLDAGWTVVLVKNGLGSYTACGTHASRGMVMATQEKLVASALPEMKGLVRESFDSDFAIDTDDFTPEQALTRLAYKVHAEII